MTEHNLFILKFLSFVNNLLLEFCISFFFVLSRLVSSPGWEHCIVFLINSLNSYSLFPLRWTNKYWQI